MEEEWDWKPDWGVWAPVAEEKDLEAQELGGA